jgi:hypothetical protein
MLRRLLIALALCLAPALAHAQSSLLQGGPWVYGDFPSYCSNGTQAVLCDSGIPASGLTPGGSSGQIQYNNSGALGGFTMAGDCVVSVPNITCTKLNGTAPGNIFALNAGTGLSVSGGNLNVTNAGAVTSISATAPVVASASTGAVGLSISGVTSSRGNGALLQLGTGSFTNGHCVQFDSNGNTVDAGGACTTGGGGGTVSSGTAGQMGYYASTGTTIAGNANATISSGALTLGVAGSVVGNLKLTGNTSGTITVQPQATAGTYNFNLPTTAGTSGQPLLSAGGSTSPMTFGTLSVGAGGTGLTAFTSGGIPYASSTSALTSSALLTQYGLIYGGGAGGSPVSMAACGSGFPILGGSTAPVCGTDANISYTDVATSYTKSQRVPTGAVTISTSTFTPNLDTTQDFSLALVHASCPCTLANPSTTPAAGQHGVITITQSATGSDTVATLGTDWALGGGSSGGIPLSSTANAKDYCPYDVVSSSLIVIGACVLNASH